MINKITFSVVFLFIISGCSWFDTGEKEEEINTDVDSKYDLAVTSQKNKMYEDAIEAYREVQALAPFSPKAIQSQLNIAYLLYKERKYDDSIIEIDRFMNLNPTSRHMAYLHYLRGLVNFSRGKSFLNKVLPHVQDDKDPENLHNAFKDFEIVITKYKNTKYANDSLRRMRYLRNTLSSYELHVANFYFKRKAYVAVINRCQYTIENYPESPKNADALIFLRESYKKLNMLNSYREVKKIIALNYPDYESPYFEKLKEEELKEDLIALSKAADDITMWFGLNIAEQPDDDFSKDYVNEYFDNSESITMPLKKKSESYEVTKIYKEGKEPKNDDDEKKKSWWWFSDEKIEVKDFTKNNKDKGLINKDEISNVSIKKELETNKTNETENVETLENDDESIVIELLNE